MHIVTYTKILITLKLAEYRGRHDTYSLSNDIQLYLFFMFHSPENMRQFSKLMLQHIENL